MRSIMDVGNKINIIGIMRSIMDVGNKINIIGMISILCPSPKK